MDHRIKDCQKKRPDAPIKSKESSGKLVIGGPASQLSKPTAWTFNMTVQDAMESRDVVSGILPVNTVNAYILFDSGATYSFISEDFAKKICVPQQKLNDPLIV